MNQKSIKLWAASLCLLAVFFASCTRQDAQPTSPSASSPAPETKGKIGMTCMDLTNPFFKLIANIMEDEAAKHGYQVVALSGDLDPAKQNNQLGRLRRPGLRRDLPEPGRLEVGRRGR